jgi:hypothetical protein
MSTRGLIHFFETNHDRRLFCVAQVHLPTDGYPLIDGEGVVPAAVRGIERALERHPVITARALAGFVIASLIDDGCAPEIEAVGAPSPSLDYIYRIERRGDGWQILDTPADAEIWMCEAAVFPKRAAQAA